MGYYPHDEPPSISSLLWQLSEEDKIIKLADYVGIAHEPFLNQQDECDVGHGHQRNYVDACSNAYNALEEHYVRLGGDRGLVELQDDVACFNSDTHTNEEVTSAAASDIISTVEDVGDFSFDNGGNESIGDELGELRNGIPADGTPLKVDRAPNGVESGKQSSVATDVVGDGDIAQVGGDFSFDIGSNESINVGTTPIDASNTSTPADVPLHDNAQSSTTTTTLELDISGIPADGDQSVNEGNGEVGNVENVNPGEQSGDDISGDIGVYPPNEVVPTRIKSPNNVTDTREFDTDLYEPTNEQLCAGVKVDETASTSPPPIPPPRLAKIDQTILQQYYNDINGSLCIPLPTLEQSSNKRMHKSAEEIVKRYSSMAFSIVKEHGCYLDPNSPTFDQHTFPLHYEMNGLKYHAAVYGAWKLIDEAWVFDKIGCALRLLGRIATYPDADYIVRVLVDMDAIPFQAQELLKQNTMEMIKELACPSNRVYEPLRLFNEKLLYTVGIDAGIGRSITLQAIEKVAYDVKSYDQGSRVKIIAEFARSDSQLHETMCDQVMTAAFSFSQLPEVQRFYEGKKVLARALVNWASGKRKDQESSHIKHTENVGIPLANIRDALQPRFPDASKVGAGAGAGDTLRFNSDYSTDELAVGAGEYSIELKDCIKLALEGNLVYCMLNFWHKYFTWSKLVQMITSIHLEVDATSSLEVGFKMISQVFKTLLATGSNQLPSELVYFVLNLPCGGSVLACVNKSFSSAADATNKISDNTALRTALAQQFVATTLSEMQGETVTQMKCIQAVHDKLKIQDDLHLSKIHSAAFSRYSISGTDSFLTCGSGRSETWTKQANRRAKGDVSMSRTNENGKRSLRGHTSYSISWYGMIALTQGGTVQECFGNLAIYCAESSNPSKCWKKVLADLYGCEWYPILKKIVELTYNITLPSDEAQQARLDQRKSAYEEKLRLTRATSANRVKRKVYVLPEVPLEPNVSLDVYITNLLFFTINRHV